MCQQCDNREPAEDCTETAVDPLVMAGAKLQVVEIIHDGQSYFDCCITEGLQNLGEEAEIGLLPPGDYIVRFHEMTEQEYAAKLKPGRQVDWLPVWTEVQ